MCDRGFKYAHIARELASNNKYRYPKSHWWLWWRCPQCGSPVKQHLVSVDAEFDHSGFDYHYWYFRCKNPCCPYEYAEPD